MNITNTAAGTSTRRYPMNIRNITEPVDNEEGSIIVIALIMLMLVTVMGLSATTTTTIEMQIAGNDRTYKENFYLADSAVYENAQRIENGGDALKNPDDTAAPVWFIDETELPVQNDITDAANWTDGNSTISIDATTRFLTIYEGVTQGSSLDVSRSRLYSYQINSRTVRNRGQIFLEGGFRRAF
jgi:Tfp pilus assembly protein PilX